MRFTQGITHLYSPEADCDILVFSLVNIRRGNNVYIENKINYVSSSSSIPSKLVVPLKFCNERCHYGFDVTYNSKFAGVEHRKRIYSSFKGAGGIRTVAVMGRFTLANNSHPAASMSPVK